MSSAVQSTNSNALWDTALKILNGAPAFQARVLKTSIASNAPYEESGGISTSNGGFYTYIEKITSLPPITRFVDSKGIPCLLLSGRVKWTPNDSTPAYFHVPLVVEGGIRLAYFPDNGTKTTSEEMSSFVELISDGTYCIDADETSNSSTATTAAAAK